MTDRKLWWLAGAGAVLGIVGLSSLAAFVHTDRTGAASQKRAAQQTATPKPAEISLSCPSGKNALDALKDRAVVGMGGAGSTVYVTTINGYRANESRHEYWAFYVNGALSDNGPADYTCNDGDSLAWKITAY